MKTKRWWIIASAGLLLLILTFPLIMKFLINLMTVCLDLFKMQPMIYIMNINQMDFSDYVSIIVSLSSCACTGIIGYVTYKLTKSVEENNLFQKRNKERNLEQKICDEINTNFTLVQNYINKLEDHRIMITLDSFGTVYSIKEILSAEDFSDLKTLYTLFIKCKNFEELSSAEIEQFASINIGRIRENLQEGNKNGN